MFGLQLKGKEATLVLPMGTDADLAKWDRLDDVIMGGRSSSTLQLIPSSSPSAAGDSNGSEAGATLGGAAEFSGELVIEGGGFCGARTKVHLSPSFPVQLASEAVKS